MEALMFGSRRKTVIAKGLKIEGRVTAEGLVELNGQIEGNCTASRSSSLAGLSSRERFQPIRWLSMERSRVRSEEGRSFSSPGRMWSAIFTTDLSRLRMGLTPRRTARGRLAPILMTAATAAPGDHW
jgi:hypothetical protein